MIRINWDPTPYLGPIPINWYGLNFRVAFVVSGLLVRNWAPRWGFSKTQIESLLAWILVGTIIGARIYFVVQNDFVDYLSHPWRIAALWEGGLAFFGGLAGGILAAYLYARRLGLSFLRLGDLFAPARDPSSTVPPMFDVLLRDHRRNVTRPVQPPRPTLVKSGLLL